MNGFSVAERPRACLIHWWHPRCVKLEGDAAKRRRAGLVFQGRLVTTPVSDTVWVGDEVEERSGQATPAGLDLSSGFLLAITASAVPIAPGDCPR